MKPNPRRIVPLVVLAIVVFAAVRFILPRLPRHDLDASGTVEATEAQLGFEVPGRVEAVLVHEGDSVSAGRELARLDRREAEARAEQAGALAAAAHAQLDELERGYRPEEVEQARAARDAAKQRVEDARRDLQRARDLFGDAAVSRQALDKAATASEVAENQLQAADEQLRLMRTGPRKERIEAARAQVRQAEAAATQARVMLENMVIRAPFKGVVTVRHREPGEVIPAGSPVVSLLNRDDRWVRIYVREDRIAAVRVGGPATIRCDTYPDRRYAGRISFIASQAEFTPRSVQTTEERVKLVYALKISVAGDSTYDLKPGMPADVRLDLRGK